MIHPRKGYIAEFEVLKGGLLYWYFLQIVQTNSLSLELHLMLNSYFRLKSVGLSFPHLTFEKQEEIGCIQKG